MKTITKLTVVCTMLITSGTLFASSVSDSSDVYTDQQVTVDEPMYFGEDVKIVEKAYKTLQKSAMAVDNIMDDPENCIPLALFTQAEGIVIFPRALKIAIGTAGGQGGNGIAMIRMEDGTWSNPFFVALGEASVGIQIGAQKSDIVLLFKNRNDIIAIDEADVMLGTGIGVAAGPVSRGVESVTDIKFDAEIYSYQRSKGLFAGLSLKGGVLSSNSNYNETLYCMNDVTTDDIFFNDVEAPYNEEVSDLIDTLNKYSE